jgi:predicted acylesterase/phospholipase RssA
MTEEAPEFHILALTGGGFRGLYTARVLERLEDKAGRPIGQYFDLIAGTSIGGILALAVAFEVPMSQVVSVFRDNGEKIFPKRSIWAGVFGSRYDSKPLNDVISALFPVGATLSEALHALVIPTLNLTKGKQQVLKTRHNPEWNRDQSYRVQEIALATSAAPIYFPIAEIDNQLFSDGGLFANAPDLVALHEANTFFDQKDGEIKMLSVGTLSSSYSVPASINRKLGVMSWLKPPSFPLIQTILAAQQQFSIQLVQHRLGPNYLRIDSTPSEAVMADIGLDKAGTTSQQALLGLASKDVSDVLGTDIVRSMLNHAPRKWLIGKGG